MHKPTTAEIWQTAFGKDFREMVQRDNKTGQKASNAMFMTHNEIHQVLKEGKKFTYANLVVDQCAQNEDSNRICITVGGKSINYYKGLSVPVGGSYHCKTPLEQCHEHSVGKIHVR
jgi:hypothetical protein